MRGHVERRGKTGSYVIDVAPDPATGRRRQRRKGGFPTKGAAEDAMREAIAKGSSSGKGSQRLGDYLAEWIVTVRPRLRETTFNGYQMAVDRVTAGLGAVRMDDLTPLAIERFYAELLKTGGRREQGLSAKSVRNTHVALCTALADAERLALTAPHPAATARPPSRVRAPIVTHRKSSL